MSTLHILIFMTMWWLWWLLAQSCYAKTPRGNRAPTLSPGDGRPHLPVGWCSHPTAWKIASKTLWCAKIDIFISSISMGFSMKFLNQSWHWNFKGEGGIRVHHDCRKRDWRAISSHVELEWLNEMTALWLILLLQNEETANHETPLSCWWGNGVLVDSGWDVS